MLILSFQKICLSKFILSKLITVMTNTWNNLYKRLRIIQYEVIQYKEVGYIKGIFNITFYFIFMNALIVSLILRNGHFGDMMNPMTHIILRFIANLTEIDYYVK